MESLGGLFKLMSKILRVVNKRIAVVKCDLFFHYRDSKELLFYYFRDTKLGAKHKKKHVNFIYIVENMFVR